MDTEFKLPDMQYGNVNKSEWWVKVGLCLVLGISLASFYFSFKWYREQPKIVAFDVKQTTKSILSQIADLENVSEDDKKKMTVHYEKTMKAVVAEYQANNTIIIVKNAVVSPIPDKTSEIKRKIIQRMKKKSSEQE